jgi:hypothetical protein
MDKFPKHTLNERFARPTLGDRDTIEPSVFRLIPYRVPRILGIARSPETLQPASRSARQPSGQKP